jgi:hypothetical protein
MKLGITLVEGLVVSEVNDPQGCCAAGGVTIGDVLTGVNNQPGTHTNILRQSPRLALLLSYHQAHRIFVPHTLSLSLPVIEVLNPDTGWDGKGSDHTEFAGVVRSLQR